MGVRPQQKLSGACEDMEEGDLDELSERRSHSTETQKWDGGGREFRAKATTNAIKRKTEELRMGNN